MPSGRPARWWVTAVQPRALISGRTAARPTGSVARGRATRRAGSVGRVASIPAMIGSMRLRGHGASTPVAAAASLRPGARITFAVLLAALAGCSPAGRASVPLMRFEAGENLGAITVADGDVWVNDFGREEVV